MRILIIANARFRGGTSGSDKIYESFIQYWPDCSFRVWNMIDVDYKPFFICYLHRVFVACIIAVFEPHRYDMVYSASDFLPDAVPALLYKVFHGTKWVAGFYLKAFRENRVHFLSQKLVKWFIDKFADMVIVTNKTMYNLFPDKKKTWINGGVDLSLAGVSRGRKLYDAVFVGRIHQSKGIDELIEIWRMVREKNPNARIAVIGDGDLGKEYLFRKMGGATFFGFLNDSRYSVYKQSRVVLYPTPLKYDHFSMAPVEAMACGCPMICFDTPVNRAMNPQGCSFAKEKEEFARLVLIARPSRSAYEWAAQFEYKNQSLRVYEDIGKGIQ